MVSMIGVIGVSSRSTGRVRTAGRKPQVLLAGQQDVDGGVLTGDADQPPAQT